MRVVTCTTKMTWTEAKILHRLWSVLTTAAAHRLNHFRNSCKLQARLTAESTKLVARHWVALSAHVRRLKPLCLPAPAQT